MSKSASAQNFVKAMYALYFTNTLLFKRGKSSVEFNVSKLYCLCTAQCILAAWRNRGLSQKSPIVVVGVKRLELVWAKDPKI